MRIWQYTYLAISEYGYNYAYLAISECGYNYAYMIKWVYLTKWAYERRHESLIVILVFIEHK